MVVQNGTAVQRVSNREEDSMNLEPSLSGKEIIGIIYPPPDIRSKYISLFLNQNTVVVTVLIQLHPFYQKKVKTKQYP